METPINSMTAGSIILSDYIFSIAYAYRKVTDKRDYYLLKMTYDIDKLDKLNRKYNFEFSMDDLDKKYDNKEFEYIHNIDDKMAELLMFFGDQFFKASGKKPRNLKIMKGFNDDNSLFFYTFFLKKK